MLLLNLALYSFMCIVQHPETDSELELENGDADLTFQRPSSEPDTSEGGSVSLKTSKIVLPSLFFIILFNNKHLIFLHLYSIGWELVFKAIFGGVFGFGECPPKMWTCKGGKEDLHLFILLRQRLSDYRPATSQTRGHVPTLLDVDTEAYTR